MQLPRGFEVGIVECLFFCLRIFDQGLLAVTPDGTVDVADSLKEYDLYSGLHAQQLKVITTARQREWLALHWAEWRTQETSP